MKTPTGTELKKIREQIKREVLEDAARALEDLAAVSARLNDGRSMALSFAAAVVRAHKEKE